MSLVIDYDQLTAEIGDFLGYGRSGWSVSGIEETRILSCLKSGLRQVYYPHEFKEGVTHVWSWLRPEATVLTTPQFNDGTVEIVAGVVTLTGGTWPSWAAEGEISISSQVYTVNTRDSDTQVTLDDTSVAVAAGTSYELGRPTYDLDAGFSGNFDGDLHYKTGDNTLWPPLLHISPEQMRKKKQHYNDVDRPLFYAIRPKALDATAGQQWLITFYPTPDGEYTLHGRYKVRPAMLDATNKYPHGGPEMGEVFLESCLAVAEKRFVEDQTRHRDEFLRLLLQAIDNDADAYSPDFLGYNSDRSEGQGEADSLDRRYDNAIHSVEGVVYYD